MRFLIDEDLPRSTGSLLRQYGHEATDIRDIGLRGAGDPEVAACARERHLCLLSSDAGFADIRNYPPAQYSGIVVLHAPAKATSSTILALVGSFLAQREIVGQLDGKLAIVGFNHVRIRKG